MTARRVGRKARVVERRLPLSTLRMIAGGYVRPGYVMNVAYHPDLDEVMIEHESPLGGVRQAFFDIDVFSQPQEQWEPLVRRELEAIA